MISVFEERRRVKGVLYKVLTVYLFGLLPVLRTWELLTVKSDLVLPSEKKP